jgi:hypothetical protein
VRAFVGSGLRIPDNATDEPGSICRHKEAGIPMTTDSANSDAHLLSSAFASAGPGRDQLIGESDDEELDDDWDEDEFDDEEDDEIEEWDEDDLGDEDDDALEE